MKMDVIPVQSIYGSVRGSNKTKDWTSTLTPPVTVEAAVAVMPKKSKTIGGSNSNSNSNATATATSIKHKQPAGSSNNNVGQSQSKKTKPSGSYNSNYYYADEEEGGINSSNSNSNNYYSLNYDMKAVDNLSLRLLDELRAAKSRHLTCTEVSLPCDLTPSVAREIIRVSEKEPCGIRGCTIYIEFEDEPKNSRRIASIKIDPDTVSTFEVYLTLRQDHRGWTSLLPQFMKSLARTITISPEYTITKNKLYSADGLGARRSYSFGSHAHSPSAAIATPTN
ncbi:protein scylla [Drosophila eugracilis]|uniref:protein scylla n=1 Tax=Drosophila eugracilis TaxID=29029 RepID=UPI0007E67BE5|nr:protein scylla [Drosophila eugracilis]